MTENPVQNSHRCFLGLKFSPQQQQQLQAYQHKELCPDASWHPAANLHLTLVFLGQQNVANQQQLWADCLKLLHSFPAVQLCFNQLQQFSRAKVFYLGLSEPPQALLALQQHLLQLALPYLDQRVAEPFVPHITLARKCPLSTLLPLAVEPLHLFCTEVALYHSLSSPQGVRYQAVHSSTLVKI
jgi:2'-5' RNA ligase